MGEEVEEARDLLQEKEEKERERREVIQRRHEKSRAI